MAYARLIGIINAKPNIFVNVFIRVSERTFVEQIATWIETIFKGTNDKVSNFWGPIRVRANLKGKKQRTKFSTDV